MTIIVDAIRVTPAALKAISRPRGLAPTSYYVAETPVLDRRQLDQLNRLGVSIHDQFAALAKANRDGAAVRRVGFLWRFSPDVLKQVEALDFVELLEPFSPELKVAPSLLGLLPDPGGVDLPKVSRASRARQVGDPRRVRIDLHNDVEADKPLVARIVEASSVEQSDEPAVSQRAVHRSTGGPDLVTPARIFLTTTIERIEAIAAIEEVRRITGQPDARFANNVARGILRVPWSPSPPVIEGAENYFGEGEVVAVADTGFDLGSAKIVPTAFEGSVNEERVIKLYAFGRDSNDYPPDGDADDPHGHGTHVAGSIVGSHHTTQADPDGGKGVYGIAPRARLVVQALYRANWGVSDGLGNVNETLFTDPYNCHGARVHNDSWGSPSLEYDSWSTIVDEAVTKYRDLVIVCCAGNDGAAKEDNTGIAENSIWAPGNAKNCITVGASESLRSAPVWHWNDDKFEGKFCGLPTAANTIAENPESVAPFSSRGPVLVQRKKPDLVAPGTMILSTRSGITRNEGFGLPAKGGNYYFFNSGTSMSTPLVSGCALLVREFLRRSKGRITPSAALVKATLINGARPIHGPYSGLDVGEPIPNNHQGFGLVDLSAALGQDGRSVVFKDEADSAALSSIANEDNETSWTTTVDVPAEATLKVTLVWTDPAGSSLKNDLDLIVKSLATNESWHGNMPRGSAVFDEFNNVEQVTWEDFPEGEALITVVAKVTLLPPQTFALVYSIGPGKSG